MNIKNVIEDYLILFSSNQNQEAERIQQLIISLDKLALAAHNVSYTFDDRDYSDPPEEDYRSLRERIIKLFPSLGYYNVALDISKKIKESSLCLGDAIDDIADITSDLEEVIWRFENTSEDDALFYFQFLFRSHWGMHLRSLQLYLHDFSS